GIVEMRKLLRSAFLIPGIKLLGKRAGVSGKEDFAGFAHGKGVGAEIERAGRIFTRTIGREADEFGEEAVADSDQQAAIAGESVIENGPVEACAGQIGGDSFALADDHEVVRSGSVLAAANESKALAVGSHADAAEGPARSEDRRQSIVGKPKNEDAAGVLI